MKKSSAIFLAFFVVIITAVSSLFLGAFVAGQVDFSNFFQIENLTEKFDDFDFGFNDEEESVFGDDFDTEFSDDLTHDEDLQNFEDTTMSEWSGFEYADEHLYAIKFLGYGIDPSENYKNTDLIDVGGDEFYLIVPRFDECEVKVKMMNFGDFSDMSAYETLNVFTSNNGEPFILKCNVSDIYSNVAVTMTGAGGSASFSPRISLEDGSLIAGELGFEIK